MAHAGSAQVQDEVVDVVILTVIPAELEAARRVLQLDNDSREKDPDGTVYFRGAVRSELARRDYAIVLTCIGSAGNSGAAAAASTAIAKYHPRAVLLMGIAAGIRDKLQIGEVVLSDRVVAYEPAALVSSADGTEVQPRPEIDRAPHTMIQDVMSYRSDPARLRTAFERAGGTIPTVPAGREDEFLTHVASAIGACQATIASGEKLLRDPSKLLAVREQHGKVEVGEMEAAGLVDSCRRGSVPWLVIRGISDFADEFKDDRFHTFASCAASAVLHDFIAHGLDLSTASSLYARKHDASVLHRAVPSTQPLPDLAERVYMDKLADTYAAWFDKAFRAITDIIDDLHTAIQEDKKSSDLPMLYNTVKRVYRGERELRLAAAPLLVVERNQAYINRLKKTYETLPSWPGPTTITLDEVGKYRAFTKAPPIRRVAPTTR